MTEPTGGTAVVVGSGPNGLAAAATLARAGVAVTVLEAAGEIGGGTRTSDLTGQGPLHDHCSAVHPFALGSAFAHEVDLAGAGLRLCQPEIDLAHPLDDGSAGVLLHSLDDTVAGLGADGPAWRRLLGPVVDGLPALLEDAFQPVLRVPHHPIRLARFGLRGALPARAVARSFSTEAAKGLWGGVAAHGFHPFDGPMTSTVGLMLIAAAHGFGWVVAEGGSRSITDAMAKVVVDHGGRIETSAPVSSLRDLPDRDLTLLDVAPSSALRLAGADLPRAVARAYRHWKHGPAAFKLDLVVEGGVPWTNEHLHRAGSVHLGGTFAEIARAERDVWEGRMPERPFVLVGQQYLADPTRSAGNLHPIWTYAHVPNGWPGDATEAILDQLERFAPGVRERVVGRHTTSPAQFAAINPNYVGGDIISGANNLPQVALRPRISPDPYSVGIPGTYLCSAATPPGPGAHGMCGYNAARRALHWLSREAPS